MVYIGLLYIFSEGNIKGEIIKFLLFVRNEIYSYRVFLVF